MASGLHATELLLLSLFTVLKAGESKTKILADSVSGDFSFTNGILSLCGEQKGSRFNQNTGPIHGVNVLTAESPRQVPTA